MNDSNAHRPYSDSQIDDALRGLHRQVMQEPLPDSLLQSAQRVDGMRPPALLQRHVVSVAVSVMLAFGLGWWTHGTLLPGSSTLATKSSVPTQEFVRQAAYAYATYMPEKRHPVEVAASDQEHLVQWLSKRLGKPLHIPQLGGQGFELVGGRLLPGAEGARAQFMYQNPQGLRVTLYLGALNPTANTSVTDLQATQFRWDAQGPVPSFYWVDRGFGYALSGPLESSALMALARTVYEQLDMGNVAPQ